ncbi:NusB antitermination factor [Crinalium epipsammum PCC 9333]|uniref:Transcription antitermination protein NusB n=2 Tax=Crinalium TaxID=241421 RepID=K9W0B7_9CYAN|nr:NusB antitermination factor [Crinalium epipsammum PCC 9333]
MMQPRRIARDLAVLSLSQLPNSPEKLSTQQLSNVMLSAIRTLTSEAQEALEAASAELQRSSDRLLSSQTRAADIQSARTMVNDAVELTQAAINRLGNALELPEFIQLANQHDVRAYSLELLTTVSRRRTEIDELLSSTLKEWQLSRVPRIDRDILRIAVAEIWFLGVPDKVAINEAVDLAKRYSDEDGRRFINGVLRRASEEIKQQSIT